MQLPFMLPKQMAITKYISFKMLSSSRRNPYSCIVNVHIVGVKNSAQKFPVKLHSGLR